MSTNLLKLAEEIIDGKRITRADSEILENFKTCNLQELTEGANLIREKLCGKKVDLCTIINGKSGRCGENCKFCAQSIHNHTNCETYDFVDQEKIVEMAKSNAAEGVHRFSIVTAGKALSGDDFEKALSAYRRMKKEIKIDLCASMGFVSKEQLMALKEAGVTSYHHNIETSRRNFPNICTTHSYEMKLETLKMVKECGLWACSGGIIGMGETMDDRIDMALDLSQIGVDSIPINALMPIPGTPLENLKSLSEEEILRTIALFRYINPKADIRLAAGRKLLTNSGEKAFLGGANSTITGNMLTTTGTTIKGDIELIKRLNLEI